jgi:hypothetical protein
MRERMMHVAKGMCGVEGPTRLERRLALKQPRQQLGFGYGHAR